jgi:Universal stress protein family
MDLAPVNRRGNAEVSHKQVPMKSSSGSTTRDRVVGLDDSRSARAALRWASDHARRTGVVLRAVHALSWPFGVRSPDLDSEAERHLSFDDVDARYRASITAVFDDKPTPGLVDPVRPRRRRTRFGPTVQECVASRHRYAGTCGTRTPHRRLGRPLCLSQAACPLVAVPTDLDPALEISAQRIAEPIA